MQETCCWSSGELRQAFEGNSIRTELEFRRRWWEPWRKSERLGRLCLESLTWAWRDTISLQKPELSKKTRRTWLAWLASNGYELSSSRITSNWLRWTGSGLGPNQAKEACERGLSKQEPCGTRCQCLFTLILPMHWYFKRSNAESNVGSKLELGSLRMVSELWRSFRSWNIITCRREKKGWWRVASFLCEKFSACAAFFAFLWGQNSLANCVLSAWHNSLIWMIDSVRCA